MKTSFSLRTAIVFAVGFCSVIVCSHAVDAAKAATSTLSPSAVPTMAVSFEAVEFAEPPPANYTPVCNRDRILNWDDMYACYTQLQSRAQSPCIANPNGQFCNSNGVFVSGLPYYANTVEQDNCAGIANAVAQIWECRTPNATSRDWTYYGGSAPSSGNPNLIVHLQPFWVTAGVPKASAVP